MSKKGNMNQYNQGTIIQYLNGIEKMLDSLKFYSLL